MNLSDDLAELAIPSHHMDEGGQQVRKNGSDAFLVC